MPQSAAAHERQNHGCHRELSLADGPGRGLRVELVRVVEHGRLGGARRLPVVVCGDRVEELGANRGVETGGPLLDQAQAEMDVTEQAPLLRRAERGPAAELERAADVVQSAAASRRSPRRRGWSWAVSRQSVATPTVCSSSPPA